MASAERADTGSPDALEAARKRRRELHAVLVDVERSIARPAPGRADQWLERVASDVVRLRDSFEDHVRVTEDPQGLYDHILTSAPRLTNLVRQLRAEHVEIGEAIDRAAELIDVPSGREPDDHVAEVRRVVMAVLSKLSHHRQKGSDLVYEAYEVDVGGVD